MGEEVARWLAGEDLPPPAQNQAVRIKASFALQQYLWDRLHADDNTAAQIWEMIGALNEAESLDALFSAMAKAPLSNQ